MKYFKIIISAFIVLLFVSCSDQWHIKNDEEKLIENNWKLHMYIDGVKNEMVDVENIIYDFMNDGELKKYLDDNTCLSSTWKLIDRDYLRIGSSTFKLRTLTSKILTLEYGEDVIYFLPQ